MAAEPSALRVTPGQGLLSVAWTVTTTTGLGGWLLHWRPKATTAVPWETAELPASARSYVISGLQTETYEVQLRALLAGASVTTSAIPLPVTPPSPMAFKGICAGYWGPQELADLAVLSPQLVRLENPTSITPWSAHEKVIYLQSTDANGHYTTAGVQSINVAAFVAHVAAVVAANPSMTYLEIINEAAGEWFWGPNANTPASAAAYARIVRAVWEARKTWAVKPLLLACCDGGRESVRWFEWMLAADPQILECFDYPTVHDYGGTGDRARSAEGARAVVTQIHAMTGKPVAVTEIGWPTEEQTGDSLQWTEDEQAANVASYLAWAKATGYVVLVTIYNYRGGKPGYGLIRADDTRKPACEAFERA